VDNKVTDRSADAQTKDLQGMIDDVREAIAELHEVRAYAVVLLAPGSLPKTSSGKLQRFACRAGFLDGNLHTLAHWVQEPELQA
jgi:acyl-CoA synthetase (AMP-forming)/AMP-acid ligase II